MLTTDQVISKRRNLEHLRTQMDNERTTFVAHWKDLADNILPRRGRFETTDNNKGGKVNKNIIDSTATTASRTLQSGMMSGVTSPARPWFKLSLGADEDFGKEFGEVKTWLSEVTKAMLSVFLKSNLYNVLPTLYGDTGTFATGCMYLEEDAEDVIRCQSFPVGSYMIANDDKGRPRVFMREFRLTVRQVVKKFGMSDEVLPNGKTSENINWENISAQVKVLFDEGNLEAWVEIVHCIKPNEDYDPNKLDSKYKEFISIYYEQGFSGQNSTNISNSGGGVEGKFLSMKGYDYFPVFALRWETTGSDVYGTNCPGMTALGDIRQLQLGEKRVMQAIDKIINPPLIGPTSLKNNYVSMLPGDVTYTDEREGSKGLRPMHEVNFRVNEMEGKQEQVRQRIKKVYFEDLFLQLTQLDRRQITATEIDARHEEKLLALGPVLEQLNQDLLDPLIDVTFQIMDAQGKIPKPPEEIQGVPMKIEYISIMAQAQKLVGLGGIDRFTQFVGSIAEADPSVLDKIDSDELVDIYADITSVPPSMIRSKDDVEELRAEREQAAQQQQMAEQAPQAVGAIRDMSETIPSQDSLLNQLTGL